MWLAADIGGTKLAAAGFDGQHLLGETSVPTNAGAGEADVIKRLLQLLERVCRTACIDTPEGIGLACPGPLSVARGTVIHAPCLGWREVPIARIVAEHFHCPVRLENDANAAALGEYCFGAGQGAGSLAYITVSTGVGCGLIIDGRLLAGAHESAGELGHVVIRRGGKKCACGRHGCLERYASGTAIGEAARKILRARGVSDRGITAREAARMAYEGDGEMRDVFSQAGRALGQGIAALLQLIDVERVVIGGSVAQSLDLMEPAIRAAVAAESYWGSPEEDWLRRARLGGASGLYGAGALISQTKGEEVK